MVFSTFMDKLCRIVFLKETAELPSTYYLGFSTTAPTSDGANISEPNGVGYGRVALTNLATSGNGVVSNADEIDCGEASGSWGTLTWCILFDSQTGGNPLSAAQMSKPITVDEGETLKLKAGNIKLYFGEAQVIV